MTKSLIVYSGNDPQFLAIAWHLAATARADGHEVELLDLTAVVRHVGDSYNRRLLRIGRIPAPDIQFAKFLASERFTRIDAAKVTPTLVPSEPSEDARRAIAQAVRSALVSYARDPDPTARRGAGMWSRLERSLQQLGRASYGVVASVLNSDPSIGTVYVFNGRFPHQRGAIEAARAAGREVRYYEKGYRANSFWLADHSTHDRIATQASVDAVLAAHPSEDAVQIGRDWMNGRARPGSSNVFARFFATEGDSATETEPRKPLVGLFTSSNDEFVSLGPDWHIEKWKDQLDGFDHALTLLEPRGFDFYLRVHPNFTGKSHRSFLEERDGLRDLQHKHPKLRIIWHDEQVNSYSLIGETAAVVVWNSTIGLEASGRGVPVWTMAAAYYDRYADVRSWLSPDADPSAEEFLYPVDAERAQRFMAYLVLRDMLLPAEAVALRTKLTPPASRARRMAAMAASGGAPSPAVAAASIIDSTRHRRFALNRIAAQNLIDSGRS